MSTPVTPPQAAGPAVRRATWPGAQMRVSDADRMAVADLLGRHYSAGRLGDAEFEDRLDRAMRATTMADLTGLLSDLPDADAESPLAPGGSRRQQRKLARIQLEREALRLRHEQRHHRAAERRRRAQALRWLLLAAAAVIALLIVARALTHSIGAWLIVGVIVVLWLRRPGTGLRSDASALEEADQEDSLAGGGPVSGAVSVPPAVPSADRSRDR